MIKKKKKSVSKMFSNVFKKLFSWKVCFWFKKGGLSKKGFHKKKKKKFSWTLVPRKMF